MATAEQREPYESRGSRTVLGARGGAILPRDSTCVTFNQRSAIAAFCAGFASRLNCLARLDWVTPEIPAEMFREVAGIGTLNAQLLYYRGLSECKASRWISESGQLLRLMERLDCRAGTTQIGKVLATPSRRHSLIGQLKA
jgi:hypothetical protein